MRSLDGRVVLVTGVSRRIGIGYAIAKRLAERGADLFLTGLAEYDASQPWGADAHPIITDFENEDVKSLYLSMDLSEPSAPKQAMQAAVEAYGHIDILVINHAYSTMGDLEALTAPSIDTHLQVNVRASLLLIQAFAAQHNGNAGGRVIMMTSGQHLNPMPAELAYIASKGALHQLTRSLAAHLASRRITVNTVNPGATDTGYADEVLYQQILAHQPMGRWGQPDDAARLVAWLATDEARWITGQVINSTGGGL